MGWILAIDVGTTSTAAARRVGTRVEMIRLQGSTRMSSAVFWREGSGDASGRLALGDEAEDLATLAPWCLERAPKNRIGEEIIQLGERQFRPTELIGALLGEVFDEALRLSGGEQPDEVRLTHPARWGGTRLEILRQAAEIAKLPNLVFVPEPVAAAIHFASERLEAGEHVAVYDLGGGTFDTAVLKRTGDDFEVIGRTGGDQELGGEDFDELLYRFLGDQIPGETWEKLRKADSLRDRSWGEANRNLLRQVRRTKERLSRNPHVEFYLPSPVDRELSVSSAEFERLIGSILRGTVAELESTILRAGLRPADLRAVYLAGGSSNIPLVRRLIQSEMGIEPEHLDDPKAVIAMGAARMGPRRAHAVEVPTTPAVSFTKRPPEGSGGTLPPPGPPPPPPHPSSAEPSEPTGDSTLMDVDDPPRETKPLSGGVVGGAVAALAAVVVAIVLLTSGGDDTSSDGDSSTPEEGTTSVPSTTTVPPGPGAKRLNLQVGDVLPLSGDLGDFGEPGVKAADLAIEQIGNSIDESGSEHSVTISHKNDQTDAGAGLSAARSLVRSGASCLTGAWASFITIPIATEVSVPNRVLQISPAAASDELTVLNDQGLFNRVAPADSFQGRALAGFIAAELGGADGKVVNIGARADGYGEELTKMFSAAWEDAGGEIGATVIYDPSQSSYTSEAEQIVGGSPDATVHFDFFDTFERVAPDLEESGWEPDTAFGSDGLASPSLGSSVPGGTLDGFRVLSPGGSPDGSAASAFDELYSSSAPVDVARNTFDAENFDAVMLCYLAAAAAGSTDGRAMADEVRDVSSPPGTQFTFEELPEAVAALEDGEDIDYEGASGPIDLDDNGDPTAATYDVSRFDGSTFENVDQAVLEPAG